MKKKNDIETWWLSDNIRGQYTSRKGIIDKFNPCKAYAQSVCMYERELIVYFLSETKEIWSCIFNSALQSWCISQEV